MLDRCVKLICFVRAAAEIFACSITIVWPNIFHICKPNVFALALHAFHRVVFC